MADIKETLQKWDMNQHITEYEFIKICILSGIIQNKICNWIEFYLQVFSCDYGKNHNNPT